MMIRSRWLGWVVAVVFPEVTVIVTVVVVAALFLRMVEGTSPQRGLYGPEIGGRVIVVVVVVVFVFVVVVLIVDIHIASDPGNGGHVDSVLSEAHHSENSFCCFGRGVVVVVVVAGAGAVVLFFFAEAARLEHKFHG